MPQWPIVAITLVYVAGLIWIAHRADTRLRSPSRRSAIWTLGFSIAVYCTSWTYYGAVGTAATSGWDYLPIYLGPALLFMFGGGILKRMVEAGKEHHVSSISDFIASRYGKSQRLAATVTVIAVLGALPYIALQLKSIAMTFAVLSNGDLSASSQNDLVLIIAAFLAVFAIVFGTRHADVTLPNTGMVRAIVVESIAKLAILVAVAGFCLYLLTAGAPLPEVSAQISAQFSLGQFDGHFVSLTLLAMGAALCLPRQFHMLVVEATDPSSVPQARWVFVSYLALTALVVIPITAAGLAVLPAGTSPDLFVLLLPLQMNQDVFALITFLGGFAAATGMVIVSSVALSIMITNDLVIPAALKMRGAKKSEGKTLSLQQLSFRRLAIVSLISLAYGFHRLIDQEQTLAALGILSFAAAVQFLPALIGGLYWAKGNKRGVFAGLLIGFGFWVFTLVVPALAPAFTWADAVANSGLFGVPWLKPEALFGVSGVDPLTHGLMWSVGLNVAAFAGVSFVTRPDGIDLIQARAFAGQDVRASTNLLETQARVKDLEALIIRSLGEERAHKAFDAYELLSGRTLADRDPLDADLIRFGEAQLTRVLGASSARLLLQSVLTGSSLKPQDVVTLLDETSQTLEFNKELLRATLENIVHGVCVVDSDMRIAAWNTPYVEMFRYPDDLVSVGRPIADIIRYNADQGVWPGEDTESVIARRVGHMQTGKPHDFSRDHFDGRSLDIQGRPMPGGGYVTTYMDVTERVRAQQALKETNETLEERVAERTQALEVLNEKLERAIASKTRFLAAASHDLLQPLNAARLFTSALAGDDSTTREAAELLEKIDRSISSADTMLKALLNISKLDGDGVEARPKRFALAPLLQELVDDFSLAAKEKGLTLRYVPSDVFVRSDRALLRSVLQNFLANAVRYTPEGKVLVGCRRAGKDVCIMVVDTGLGISQEEQSRIFDEFHQVRHPRGSGQPSRSHEGVGLGLAIVQRIARLLDHDIRVRSHSGRGSTFDIVVPMAAMAAMPANGASVSPITNAVAGQAQGLRVLCIDNDADILSATVALLGRWGCRAQAVQTQRDLEALDPDAAPPDLVLLDYQLDDGATGFDYLDRLTPKWGYQPPTILMTASQDTAVQTIAHNRGVPVLAKPVSPAQLRALMRQMCQRADVAE